MPQRSFHDPHAAFAATGGKQAPTPQSAQNPSTYIRRIRCLRQRTGQKQHPPSPTRRIFCPHGQKTGTSVADFRVRRREIILIINRRDMRVAIYSSRFARVAAANGGKARSEVRSPKIKGIPSIGWDPFDFS